MNCGVGEDSWESLDCKEIQPVHPKGDQSWVFIGRTDVEAVTPVLCHLDAKSWLIWKDPDAGKDWGHEEKGKTEDEMVGWHHSLWTWVWVNSGSWWWTGMPGMLWFMGSQRVVHDWATELNWILHCEYVCVCIVYLTSSLSIHPFITRHLGCLHILAIVNKAVVNTVVHIPFWVSVLLFFK